jgi:hypothetical protein
VDLDALLSVISDGPTKSWAWRRLKFLDHKYTMYALLNEHNETAQMKVSLGSAPIMCKNSRPVAECTSSVTSLSSGGCLLSHSKRYSETFITFARWTRTSTTQAV